MEKSRVLEFESKDRILERARKYIESVDLFLERADKAIPLLLKALKYADTEFKCRVVLFLVSFAKEEVRVPLCDMMTDASETAEARHYAATQLNVIGPLLKDPQPLLDLLSKEIESLDPERRLYATYALGWEGNSQAALPLIERLYDTDERVQQEAVNALCNLRDDRIVDLLADRLTHGSLEQKRVILVNLWRFDSKAKQVTEIYLKSLQDENPDVRFDALVCMGSMMGTREQLEVYGRCLQDTDIRIRQLASDKLKEVGG